MSVIFIVSLIITVAGFLSTATAVYTNDLLFKPDGFKIGCFKKRETAIALSTKDAEPEACNTFCSLKSHPLSGQFWAFAVDNNGVQDRQCHCLDASYRIRQDFLPNEEFCNKNCPTNPAHKKREYLCRENTYFVYTPCKSGNWGPNFYCKSTCPYCNQSPAPLDKWTFCGFDGTCPDGCKSNEVCNTWYECDRVSTVPSTENLDFFNDIWEKPDMTILIPSLTINEEGTILKAVQITGTESHPRLVVYRNVTNENDTTQVWKKIVEIPSYDEKPRTHLYLDQMDRLGKEPKTVKPGDVIGFAWNYEKFVESGWPDFLHKTKGGYLYSTSKFTSFALQHLGWDRIKVGETQHFGNSDELLAFAVEVIIGCQCPATCENLSCKRDGECYSCEPGYQGLYCERKCQGGRHGKDCMSVCSLNCTDQVSTAVSVNFL